MTTALGRAPLLGLFIVLAIFVAGVAQAAPNVVASIVPVHSLVASVTQGLAEPTLIVRGYGSPHTYQMRPSDAASLSRADAVFWVGESMETFLHRPIGGLADDTQVVELSKLDGLLLLPNRAGGAWQGHDQGDGGHGHDQQREGLSNAHLWLDIDNTKVMVNAIVASLSKVDPANADAYRVNGERLSRHLDELDMELEAKLRPIRTRPFVVFHDAYRYFEHRYRLNAVGSLTVGPERMPSAKRLKELRAKLDELGVECVFREPQFQSALVEALVEGTDARVSVLDPLGSKQVPGPHAYFALMRANAEAIATCLAQ